ncbi:putative PEPTIDE SYNTHETASE NRP domain protein, partial [Mycobacterium xenopi 4042]
MVLTGSAFTRRRFGVVRRASGAHPHAVALSDGQRSMTYRQLDQAANRLAHLLAAMARPGEFVACCCRGRHTRSRRSWRCQTGAAYLPIDPGHPPAHRLHGRRRNPVAASPPLS